MLVKTLKRAAIGFLIGMAVGNIIVYLSSGYHALVSQKAVDLFDGSEAVAMLFQCLLSGVYGAICFAGISFYDVERLPLAGATALHCALIILTYAPIGILLGWVGSITEILLVAGCQFVGYFIIWLILCAVYRKQVRELNKMLEDYSEREDQQP